jgi:hypothetical protein
MLSFRFAFSVLLTLGFSSPAFALLLAKGSVDQALANAAFVVEVEVLSRQPQPHPVYHKMTFSELRVDSIVRSANDGGTTPEIGDILVVQTPGGESEGNGVYFSGYPHPYVGKKYTAYLNRSDDATYTIAGFERGLQPLGVTRDGTRNRTDGINGQGTGPFLFWDPSYFPLPYYLSAPTFKNLPDFADAIDASFQAWRAPQDVRVDFLAMGCTNQSLEQSDGLNKVIMVTDSWPYQGGDIIALTRNFYVADNSNQAGQILSTDILINGVDYQFSTNGDPATYDVQDIVTHEVGHFIGMGHDEGDVDITATMYAEAYTGETIKRTLKSDDLAVLHQAYGGVGPKMQPVRTNSLCDLTTSANTGCLAVHRSSSAGGSGWWLLALTLLIVLAGRGYLRYCERR